MEIPWTTNSHSLPLQVEEGLTLLLGVLQNPALQKAAKVWYLLRAHVLQLAAVYLSLSPAHLSPELQQRIFVQGELLGGMFKTLPGEHQADGDRGQSSLQTFHLWVSPSQPVWGEERGILGGVALGWGWGGS